jgi:hypothetical protein
MKINFKILLFVIAIAIIAVFSTSVVQSLRGLSNQRQCIDNLKQIGLGMIRHADDHDGTYPSNFQAIVEYCTNIEVFVCPATGHKPGSTTTVDKWSDYHFVLRGIPPKKDKVPVAHCVPEHHSKKFGVVLFSDGSVDLFPP